jgi:hypothetical protein
MQSNRNPTNPQETIQQLNTHMYNFAQGNGYAHVVSSLRENISIFTQTFL